MKRSKPHPQHQVYPYLLRGFFYLIAIMDRTSRKVLSWRVSTTRNSEFCAAALEEALQHYGTLEIFTTDQGSQFASDVFTSVHKDAGIRLSMDGKGRWRDHVMSERLWRSLKYEYIYRHVFETAGQVRQGLKRWIVCYNTRRPYSRRDNRTPHEAYWQKPRPGYAGPSISLAA